MFLNCQGARIDNVSLCRSVVVHLTFVNWNLRMEERTWRALVSQNQDSAVLSFGPADLLKS